MKLKKLITTIVLIMLSVSMALFATACFGTGDGGSSQKYTVTLDANGGSIPNNVTTVQVEVGKTYTLPTPTKTGHNFVSWQNQNQDVASSGTWTTKSNVTLKAKWTAKTTAVTLNVNGGVGAATTSLTATYGQVLSLPTLTKTGYTFAGWKLNNSNYDAASTWSLESATATLVATWTAKTTEVTLDVDGGVGATETTLTATFGQVLELPTLTKAGYEFAGWMLNGEAYDVTSAWSLDVATATISAQWTEIPAAKTTEVTLDVDGGVGATETTLTATYGQVLALPTLTKVGYNFAGWTLNGEAYDVTSAWALEDATATLVATWTIKTTAVSLYLDGGVGATETALTAVYGQALELPTLTKVGYNFAGWTLNDEAYDVESAWALEDATATLVATWTAKTTAVTLELDGGVGATETALTAVYGQALELPTVTKVGYNFAGWTLNDEAYDVTSAWALEDATATLVATWEIKTTQVTLVLNNGEEDEIVTATYGVALELPTLTKVGYNFTGWTLNDEAYDVESVWALEDATATIVATWEAKTTQVTLVLNNGEEDEAITATYGLVLELPTLTKVGCNFTGWTLNDEAYDVESAWALEDATATLVATWTAKTTAVTLELDGGVGATETTLTAVYGQALELPTVTKVGYNFAGWTLNDEAYDVESAWALEDATATIVATWTAKTTQVTLVLENGEEDVVVTATYGLVLELPTLTNEGYNFIGWKLNDETFDPAKAWALEDETATLVAVWSQITTKIKIDVNGGNPLDEDKQYIYGARGEVITPPAVTKVGYNFAGWTLNDEAYDVTVAWDIVGGEATLVAQWTAKVIPVTFNVDGGEAVEATSFTFDAVPYESEELIPTTTKQYCTFDGWTYNGEAIDLTAAWTIDVEAIELVAAWKGAPVFVTIKYEGLEVEDATQELVYGAPYVLKSTLPGYNLVKVVIEGTEEEVAVSGDSWTYGEVTLVVKEVATKTYYVTVKDYDGTILNETPFEVVYGETFSMASYIPTQDSIFDEVEEEYQGSYVTKVYEMFFDGFKVEGTEFKFGCLGEDAQFDVFFNEAIWNYGGEDVNVTLVPTYDSLDTWM